MTLAHNTLGSLIIAIHNGTPSMIENESKRVIKFSNDFGWITTVNAIHEIYKAPLEYGFNYVEYYAYADVMQILWENYPNKESIYYGKRPKHFMTL